MHITKLLRLSRFQSGANLIVNSGWKGLLDVPSDVLYVMGGKVASNIAAGEYWRLITPIMLHAGLFHLVINVFTQCMFGIQLEREWGASQIAVIYAVAGIYGNVLSVLFAPNALSIGCSGSVFGLFGAQVRFGCRRGRKAQLAVGNDFFYLKFMEEFL